MKVKAIKQTEYKVEFTFETAKEASIFEAILMQIRNDGVHNFVEYTQPSKILASDMLDLTKQGWEKNK